MGQKRGDILWDRKTPGVLQDFFRKNEIVHCCFGLDEGEVLNYVVRSDKRILFQLPGPKPGQERAKDFLAKGYDFCSVGVEGAFCLRKGEKFLYSKVPKGRVAKVKELENEGKLTELYFGMAGGLVVRHR